MAIAQKTGLTADRNYSNIISLSAVKLYLNVPADDESFDELINDLIATSADYVYEYAREDYGITSEYASYFNSFDGGLVLMHDKVDPDSVVVKYVDVNNVDQIIPSSNYFVDQTGRTVRILVEGQYNLSQKVLNNIKVEYTSNDNFENVSVIKTAIYSMVNALFQCRNDVDFDLKNSNMVMNRLIKFITPLRAC